MSSKSRRRTRPLGARKRSLVDLNGQLNAIHRSQAVIEMALDGTITDVNDNFLKSVGYGREELIGQHHRVLIEPSQRDSGEYRDFWSKLARGEHDAGRKRLISKSARPIWMRLSYNPILDTKGKPMKVVGYGADITETLRKSAELESQVQAIHISQGVVELGLDGAILAANDNFLKMSGYALEEIRGRHHSLLVDPADRDSLDYRAFWDKLARGDHVSGMYRRLGKAGKELWLQATYDPILDIEGKPLKVIEYAIDITEQRHRDEMSAAYKSALENLSSNVMVADNQLDIVYMNTTLHNMMKVAEADLRKELPSFDASRLVGMNIDAFHKNPAHQRRLVAAMDKTFSNEFKIGPRTMRVIANPMCDAAGKRLGTVVEWTDRTIEVAVETELKALVAAANAGDLTRRMELEGKSGLFAEIGRGINQLTDNMSEVVSRVQAAAGEVSRGADEISQGSTDLSQRTEEQASSLQQTAASMEEMTSTVKMNADNSSKASQLATAARDEADKGGSVVKQAIRAMTDINEASKKIADIIGVIDEIAFQTNLLALNAAVEAARAGEQGRGFAVVASEVRNLAGRSASAAKEIKSLIQDSVRKVEEGSHLVTESGGTLEHIVVAVKKVSDIIGEIAGAGQEQSAGIDLVNQTVMQLDEMTQQNAAMVEQASAASQSMATQANALREMMARYKVSAAAAGAARTVVAEAAQGEPAPAAAQSSPRNASFASRPERRSPARPWSRPKDKAAGPPTPSPAAAKIASANGNDSEWSEF